MPRRNAAAVVPSSKRPRFEESDRTLLVGDSIIDNRDYAKPSTGVILSQWGAYVDHSVEETMTKHFSQEHRVVRSTWYNRAEAKGHPYAAKEVALYPNDPFDRVVVSVGGNDVVLDPNIISVLLDGMLEETILARVLKVLRIYRKKYPSATIFYVRPYKLTAAMVQALAERFGIPEFAIPPNSHALLNDMLEGVVEKIRNADFRVIDARWRAADVSVSQYGIPEGADDRGCKTACWRNPRRSLSSATASRGTGTHPGLSWVGCSCRFIAEGKNDT